MSDKTGESAKTILKSFFIVFFRIHLKDVFWGSFGCEISNFEDSVLSFILLYDVKNRPYLIKKISKQNHVIDISK